MIAERRLRLPSGLALGSMALLAITVSAVPARAQGPAACRFTLGFRTIHDAIPAIVGDCVEKEHYSASGDSSQRTTKGVLVWRKADNWSAFTNGYRSWINGPYGLMTRLNTERFPWEAAPVTAGITPVASPASASVGTLRYLRQTLNNCGPATVASVLDYWGIPQTQDQAEAVLRADGDPAGMVAFGIPSYVRSLGLASLMGVEGTDRLVKALIANGFPVIVDQWVSVSERWEHYRIIEGYDSARRVFIAGDPYLGPDSVIGFDEFEQTWQSDNERFYVIYPPAKHALLAAVLASADWHPAQAFAADAAKSQMRADRDPTSGFGPGYHNLNVAWDELELGDAPAAWQALHAAQAEGASAVRIGWIADEIGVRTRAKVFW